MAKACAARWVRGIEQPEPGRRALVWRLLACGVAALLLAACQRVPLCEAADASAPVRSVYLVAGQSNAAGLASVRDYTSGKKDRVQGDTQYPDVQIWGIWGAPEGAVGRDEAEPSRHVDWSALAGWHVAQPGFGYKSLANIQEQFLPNTRAGDLFGPELSLAKNLRQLPPPTPYIVKLAVANTPLGLRQHSDSWHVDGHLYQQLLQMVADAHNSKTGETNLQVAGLFFMQGETDALSARLAGHYENNLRIFITRLRDDLTHMQCTAERDFPVVLGRIQDNPAWTWRAQVRAAQQAVARQLPRVFWVDTDDFSGELVAGGVHFNEYAQTLLGERVFRAFMRAHQAAAGASLP